ncbi:MAG TPA: helix-turn-helix domain-containing protein [Lacisediminihabitans sp.]|uniref:TetR/AcrR family transcriptional regulator n=1 Tax=Lacisediminihabitans sp. TaxID=2787631 RepID=UPI002ED84895
MGLRERKRERTRAEILEVARALFLSDGYDETTMEHIAEVAEVGPSTLYRYFPTKDELVLAPIIATVGRLAGLLAERPAAEDLDTALGNALRGYLEEFDSRAQEINELRDILDKTARPRAQLWEVWNQDMATLNDAIAARAGADPAEPWVSITAHATKLVASMAIDRARDDPRPSTSVDTAESILAVLRSSVVLPRLSGAATG